MQLVLEQGNNLSSAESSNQDPPAPLPSPVTADLADTVVLDTESPLPDFSLHQDTNPRTESLCGANSTSSGSYSICSCCILIKTLHGAALAKSSLCLHAFMPWTCIISWPVP